MLFLSFFTLNNRRLIKRWLAPCLLAINSCITPTAILAAEDGEAGKYHIVSDVGYQTLDGQAVKISDYAGKWIILNYWATWCPPCRAEIPELILFHDEYAETQAVVIGVDYETNPVKDTEAFVKEYDINYPIWRETHYNGRLSALGVTIKGLPTTFIISPSGELLAQRTGMVTSDGLSAFINDFSDKTQKRASQP